MEKRIRGFTLIELSIVLIIISLIVGGIVGGQSLLHSARVNKLAKQANSYITSINAFKLQYDSLPGDITNATDYWPSCIDSGVNTCNGNGDNNMGSGGITSYEGARAWQHMSLAEILPNNFSGSQDGGNAWNYTSFEVLQSTIPIGALNSCYTISYSRLSNEANGRLGNRIMISGIQNIFSNPTPWGYLLLPKEAKSLDRKFDDGNADSGNITSSNGAGTSGIATGCLIGGGQNGSYDLSTTTEDCVMFFFFD